MICCWEVSRQPGKGNKTVQAAKAIRTVNIINSQPRDLIAYGCICTSMRKRSFHSSSFVGTKGNSQNVSSNKDISVSNSNRDGEVKKIVSSAKPNLTNIISQRLDDFRTHDNKFNKFIKLLSDPYFLVACYEDIRGKQGNMTRGIGKETLDGLRWEWFVKVAEELKTGKFDFSVSRRIEIPKANSNKMRPLTIAFPRDKIVQKALQVILEAV